MQHHPDWKDAMSESVERVSMACRRKLCSDQHNVELQELERNRAQQQQEAARNRRPRNCGSFSKSMMRKRRPSSASILQE